MSRTYVVFLDTGVSVTLPSDVDPQTEVGRRTIQRVALSKLFDLIQTAPAALEVDIDESWGTYWKCQNCGHKDAEEEFVSTKHGDNDHFACPKCGSEQVFDTKE